MPADKTRDFALRRGDGDDRPAGGGDAVELARHNEAFELGLQRNQVDVGNAQGKLQHVPLLIGKKTKQRVEPALAHTFYEFRKLAAAADKKKAEAPVAAQALCRTKHRFELVSPAEISGITDDEPVCEPPFAA